MKRTFALHISIALLLTTINEWQLYAVDPEPLRTSADPVAAELAKLAAEHKRLTKLQIAALEASSDGVNSAGKVSDPSVSDEEWMKQGRDIEATYVDPDTELLPLFLDLAKRHPDSPHSFDALFFVILRGGPQTGNVHGKPWQLKEEAIDLVWERHARDPRLFAVLQKLAEALPSVKTEALFKRALSEGDERATRAAAAFNLARYYSHFASVHERSKELGQKEQLKNFERYWKIVVTPYLQKSFAFDEERNAAEVERLLRLVTEEYGDVPALDWKPSGPDKIFVELDPGAKPRTYGELARALSFELNNIVPGRPAPEIEGIGADGTHFRLSDYKGKVVLLAFSANWCGPCVALHPMKRNLVKKYHGRPFVLLGVNRDEQIDTLRANTASGEITWRCWWDGMRGPIRESWNANGIPRMILLDDKHIFQNVAFNRFTTEKEYEDAIDALLKNVQSIAPAVK